MPGQVLRIVKKQPLEQPKFWPPSLITTSGVAVGVALVVPILVGLSIGILVFNNAMVVTDPWPNLPSWFATLQTPSRPSRRLPPRTFPVPRRSWRNTCCVPMPRLRKRRSSERTYRMSQIKKSTTVLYTHTSNWWYEYKANKKKIY